ncbi:hypothetical protein [Henriciella pelagia]|uniref:hypothetical protein n=1 Tax=Henriciella pelagia TaxID=1977912 RepID=UPI0035136A5B
MASQRKSRPCQLCPVTRRITKATKLYQTADGAEQVPVCDQHHALLMAERPYWVKAFRDLTKATFGCSQQVKADSVKEGVGS